MRRAGVRYIFCYMTNRFGVELHPKDVRWAAAEGVSQDVIAAVLLLHERSVDEIAPHLNARELEQTIVLVGRSPRLYPRGTLEALETKRAVPQVATVQLTHESRLEMLRARARQSPQEPESAKKTGTRSGTLTETIRRRFEVAELLHLGLSVRALSMATGIPPTSVHRAKRAIARAEAKQELAVLKIMDRLSRKAFSRPTKHGTEI
jgi:hypothetical protein